MKYISNFENFQTRSSISENLSYHLNHELGILESIFRIGSDSWVSLIKEAKDLFERGEIFLSEDESWVISTYVGEIGIFEGEKVLLDIPFVEDDSLLEAEYRGKNVSLNKPFRTPSGPRKFAFYTKNEKGNIVKVGFGEPGMRVNNADPKKSRSFRKRMRCENPGPKWKPRYWACNVGRYSKILGLKSNRPW